MSGYRWSTSVSLGSYAPWSLLSPRGVAWTDDGERDGVRNPDVVAPGDHVVSLRDPGSDPDRQYPAGRIGDRLFRGSGTSQAAAVVYGSAAVQTFPRSTGT
jgi:hypothetical protein